MSNIAFRVDGGKNIGLGHIMRCLSLAHAFQQRGHKVYIFSKMEEGIERARREKFEVVRLFFEQGEEVISNIDSGYLMKEAHEISELINKFQIDALLIDSYYVDHDFFLALRPHVRVLAYVDDVNKLPYPVDIVINGNITGEFLTYRKYDEKQVLLLGLQYNMIRAEFSNLSTRYVKESVEEIMITTGGSDLHNLTGKLLAILLQNELFNNLRFNVLIGDCFRNYSNLLELRKKYRNVFLYANSTAHLSDVSYSEISQLMLRSDVAISAGGSTLYEFAACGTPTMAFILSDNQEFIVQKMDELGYILSLGWYDRLDEHQIIHNLHAIISNYQRRQQMSRNGQNLIDGKGTERIVQNIMLY